MATAGQGYIHVLGPGSYTIDGVDCGHVLRGSLKLPSSTVSAVTGRYGPNASVAEFHIPENPMLEIEFAQDDIAIYAKAIQATTRNTSGASEVLTGGRSAGGRITPVEIIYTPIASEISAIRILKCFKCVPVGEPQIVFDLEQQKLKATFKLLVDESQVENEKFFKWGVTSVSADTSAPTVSSITPADGATGVSIAVAPAITFDGQMDESSLTGERGKANAFLVKATSTGVEVPVAATVTYNNTTYIATITPTASLAASTEYDLVLTTGIKDASGNAFAGAKYTFTTA